MAVFSPALVQQFLNITGAEWGTVRQLDGHVG